MQVVLDASAIIASSVSLNSPVFRSIGAAADRLGMSICIPEIVIEEITNHYREKLDEQRQKLNQATRRYTALTGSELGDIVTEEMIEEQVAAYRTRVAEWIKGVGGRILAYPDIPHKVLATLDVARIKPFGGEKTSYRDALIWFSVLSLVAEAQGQIVFVSGNTKDFSSDSTQGASTLHPDLARQLEQRGYSDQSVKYLSSLNEFVSTFIESLLEELNGIAVQLKAGTFPTLNLEQVIADRFDGLMEDLGVDIEPGPIGFSDDAHWVEFLRSTGSYTIEQVAVKRLSERELLIDMDVWVECEFELEADAHSDLGWDLDDDPFHRSSTVHGTRVKEISAALQLTFDSDAGNVTSIRIRRLGEDRKVTSVSVTGHGIDGMAERLKRALEQAPIHTYKAMVFD